MKNSYTLLLFFLSISLLSCNGLAQDDPSNIKPSMVFSSFEVAIYKNRQLVEEQTQKNIAFLNQEARFQVLVTLAKEAQALTRDFHHYVEELRARMVLESGGFYTPKEAEKIGQPALAGKLKGAQNTAIIYRIFVKGTDEKENKLAEGPVLEQKILALKQAYLNLAKGLWNDSAIKTPFFADPSLKQSTVQQLEQLLTLSSSENYNSKEHQNMTWSAYTFGRMPVAAVNPMLHKFQYDATESEGILIFFLASLLTSKENLFPPSPYFALQKRNNILVHAATAEVIASMKQQLLDKPHLLSLIETAEKAQKLNTEFQNYINSLRDRMVLESGGAYTKEEAIEEGRPNLEGKPRGKKDKETPQRIFITGDYGDEKRLAEGPILAEKIIAMRATYLQLTEELWDSQELKGTVFAKANLKTKTLQELNEAMTLTSSENYQPEKHENKSWSEYTFGHMPVAAIYPMLRKFQNDAKTSEAALIHLLSEQFQ